MVYKAPGSLIDSNRDRDGDAFAPKSPADNGQYHNNFGNGNFVGPGGDVYNTNLNNPSNSNNNKEDTKTNNVNTGGVSSPPVVPESGGSGPSVSNPVTPVNTLKSVKKSVWGVGEQQFRIECTGLKPNTKHTAFLLDKNVSEDCAMLNNYIWGSPLISAADGTLDFDYKFVPRNSPFRTKSIKNQAVIAIIPAGNHKFMVKSSDGISTAHNFILSK